MSSIRFAAVIFDLDGLVLDSESTYFVAWRLAAAEMGHALDDSFCAALSGLPGSSVFQHMQQHCGSNFDLDRFAGLSRQHWLAHLQQHPIPVKPGFFPLLKLIELLALPYALATNSRRKDAEFCLANAGLQDTFQLLICRDDVANGKPAPDIFHKAAELLGLPVGHCLVLEDSPTGVAAAKAAGASCIFVPSQLPADPDASQAADKVFADLGEVADFVSACMARPL
jgi:HAD superfamily hydrolase (TIGR01509 family)